ncbi:MAG: HigA family addiction module antidote protein [Hydrogenophaga sp.]|jgi:antitoxin HigA-1|uniref:HigA family addiction module antitoxin n=1 Tax=Hydrogenophaga sp. TaxID=1904254 RepID=UPI002609F95B|nr:HigA family addiction module antitoxin [Hydrogenophaga sp.]MCW5672274.1 HigA family addiction module antidote protein [Hydrogenophaga sp.]
MSRLRSRSSLFAAPALPPVGVPLRAPTHPGRLLARTCLRPLSLNQSEAARLLGLSRRRLHELVHGQRAMSPDTAIRCARVFRVDASFWLAQQAAWDSFHAWKRLRAAASFPR